MNWTKTEKKYLVPPSSVSTGLYDPQFPLLKVGIFCQRSSCLPACPVPTHSGGELEVLEGAEARIGQK